MKTSTIVSLEGGRGIAALIVSLYHLGIGMQFSLIRNGYLFVDLFFVLSGFVIAAAYSEKLNDMADVRVFVIRRVGRLLPLLLFSTVAFLAIQNGLVFAKRAAALHGYAAVLNSPGDMGYFIPSPGELVSVLTMTHGLGIFDHLILNTPSWSISTEFYTYLLFAAVALMTPRRHRPTVYVVLLAVGMAVSFWASSTVHGCLSQGGCLSLTYDYGYPRSVFSFFLGALTWLASRRTLTTTKPLQGIGLVALTLLFWFVDAVPALAFGFPFAFALLILSCCRDAGPLAQVLQSRPFAALGTRSYSIYLLHMPLVLIFGNLAKRASTWQGSVAVMFAFAATLVVLSGWTYRWIEDPFRQRFNRYAARLRVTHAAAASTPAPG